MKTEEGDVLVRYRLDQAQTALDDARFLLEGGRSAMSIVNRSYYAMFYASLALLQTIGQAPSAPRWAAFTRRPGFGSWSSMTNPGGY